MKLFHLRKTSSFCGAVLLVSLGMMSCSETAVDEPTADVSEQASAATSSRMLDGKVVVEGAYTFAKDTVILRESYNLDNESMFVALKAVESNPEYNISPDGIKIIAAYSYDLDKFGTDANPWIDLNIEPEALPSRVDWLSVKSDTVDGNIGLTVSESIDAPIWSDYDQGERAIRLDVLLGLNDTQCTVCTVMVIQHRSICNEPSYDNCEGFLYSFTPESTAKIPAEGGSGAIHMRYAPDGYEYYKSGGWAIPDMIQFKRLTVAEKIGDTVPEDGGNEDNIFDPFNDWTVFTAERIMSTDGLCDLGWAKVRITDNPDGSKLFEYSISKNATGKRRKVKIIDWPNFKGPEYRLGRFYGLNYFWEINIIQSI